MPIALRLRRRIDGSLCLADDLHRVDALRADDGTIISDGRRFPDTHWFRTSWLLETPEAKLDGDTITLTLANATAVYRVTANEPRGYAVELVSSEVADTPPLDEAKAAANRAAKAAAEGSEVVEGANAGSVVVEEGGS